MRLILLCPLAILAACAEPAESQPPAQSAAPQPKPVPASETAVLRPATFAAWRAGFRTRALGQGISPATFDRAFQGVRVNNRVLELDRFQPEFSRPIWEYLDSAVSEARIRNGQAKASQFGTRLAEIEARYQVDREVITAIWGLESAYGANMGSIPVIESMATLAYDGRRRDFAEEQLLAALQILQSGDVAPSQMIGSWAGAMGHTQFIPTSYQAYAQDLNGDGRRNVWASDPSDALASTANYLASFGWAKGEPAVVEVSLPAGFDYALAGQGTKRPVSAWRALGVGAPELPEREASVIVPAGARGPAFMVMPNFQVIKRYNNATSYALAVAHLAERIGGAGPFRAAWPRGDRALSRSEKEDLQRRLTALGFDTKGADGIIGPNSRAAVRAFQQQQELVPDGYVSGALYDRVRSAGG